MTRTDRAKMGYLLCLLGLGGLGMAAWICFSPPWVVGLVVGGVLLIPGRIQGILWRDFFRGQRLLRAGQPDEAVRHFLGFREKLQRQSSLRAAIWLSWGIYTRDIGAMTANNLGVATMLLGRPDEAQAYFEEATRIDPLFPLPHAGLAELALRRNELDAARACASRATELGYHGTATDRLLKSISEAFARLEGRGSASKPHPPPLDGC